jgi:hypothetical protein
LAIRFSLLDAQLKKIYGIVTDLEMSVEFQFKLPKEEKEPSEHRFGAL